MKSYAMYRFIIKPAGMKLLLSIENDVTINELSAKTGITKGHINNILIEMQKEELIDRSYKNRHIGERIKPSVYNYNRTDKGNDIAIALREIKKIIGRN